MSSCGQIVRQVLVDQGLVSLPNPLVTQFPNDGTVVCFVPSMPDDYDVCMRIKTVPGLFKGTSQRGGKPLEHPGLHFLFRHTNSEVCHDLAELVSVTLGALGRTTTVLNGVTHYIQSIYRVSGMIELGEETGKKRWLWSFSGRIAFQLDMEPSLG